MHRIKAHAKATHAARHSHLGVHSTSAHAGYSHTGHPHAHHASGGKVHSDAAEDRAMIRHMVKPSALNRADGGHVTGHHGKHKGKHTHVNIEVHPANQPVPIPVPAGGPAPMQRPMPPQGAGPMAGVGSLGGGGNQPLLGIGGGQPTPPPINRKSGGAVPAPQTTSHGSGLVQAPSNPPMPGYISKKTGGKVHMHAGAGSGEDRLEKKAWYGDKKRGGKR